MSNRPSIVTVHCLSLREYFTTTHIKSMLRGFVYEYETPKIVTIHSISIALMCRLIQILILIYGIAYLMIHKKGYQETNTSIISSITLKVKGIGYNQTSQNQTLVIDGADYIVPPQENNALFLMTNFIRTDQEHKRCAESPDETESACVRDIQCQLGRDFHKANGKWTGRCLLPNSSSTHDNSTLTGRCEIEGWCPVENDVDIPSPIRDALNFTIFIKNFIEFPRFEVIRKNIQANSTYLKSCNYDNITHQMCPIFRVGTLLNLVEPDLDEQTKMLTFGGVIRVKIDWDCNLDKPLDQCKPAYSFGRLDDSYKIKTFSQGFNFRFASHWKHHNRSFRTLTKAFGLRFIISVSGFAGRFHVITLSLNIGSLIGILGLATFICDIVALYVHRQSDLYRQQKFQDVDLNLLRLETLNSLPLNMMSEEQKQEHVNHVEQAILTGHVINNTGITSLPGSPYKDLFRRQSNHFNNNHSTYDEVSGSSSVHTNPVSTPMLLLGKYHQQPVGINNSLTSTPSSIKQRRPLMTTPTMLPSKISSPSIIVGDKSQSEKSNIVFADEDSSASETEEKSSRIPMDQSTSMPIDKRKKSSSSHSTTKIETFL